MLERPINEVLHSGTPDFPFCLAWANVEWTNQWVGENRTLIEQVYPGFVDHQAHFDYLLSVFNDPRYIKVNDKPLFYIHRPLSIPDVRKVTDLWRELAQRAGLKGLYLVACKLDSENLGGLGFDAYSYHFPDWQRLAATKILNRYKLTNRLYLMYKERFNKPAVFDYNKIVTTYTEELPDDPNHHPLVISNWDNTPRFGWRGVVLHNSAPEAFRQHFNAVLHKVSNNPSETRIIFAKSWNEWAEGNYLEPDQRYGKAYLEVIRSELCA
jgi:hypothetical protein